ncbi:MAG: MarR family transcriptional regulator [Rhizobiaceae bacterium]|nr:MarR family transcriptional regulator [Rhizobiaceae bacterium]
MSGPTANISESSAGQPVVAPPEPDEDLDFPLVELFFFAYRDFIADADGMLEEYGFGRAHHRVLHFVNRRPGMVVAELLEILRITKQSLGPVLRQLVESGHLVQIAGPEDRRQRLLYPTQKGRNLSIQLTHMQSRRIKGAIEGIKNKDRESIRDFLFGMIEPEERDLVNGLMEQDQ